MKVAAHGYHAGKAWLCMCCRGTSLFEILDPPLIAHIPEAHHDHLCCSYQLFWYYLASYKVINDWNNLTSKIPVDNYFHDFRFMFHGQFV